MTAPLLDLLVLRKRFGDRLVLRDARIAVRAGEIVSLVGASGCGKSTLLRIVAGLETGYEGELRFDGRVHHGLTREIGFIFQEPRLFPWLTVAENVAFDLGREGRDDPRVEQLLGEVGLAGYGTMLPKQLSGGQAQRVAIARGLFTRPRLLLLDEPFSAVDAFTRMKLQDLLVQLAHRRGITLLLVTHDIDEAVFMGDRVIVLDARTHTVSATLDLGLARPRARGDAGVAQRRAQVLEALHAVQAL